LSSGPGLAVSPARDRRHTGNPALPARDIRLLVLDVDGVLTDGTLLFDEEGCCYRRYHIRDGLAIRMWREVGRKVAILTSKTGGAIQARATMMGIDLIEQGADDKLPGFERILSAAGVPAEQTAYMGDDLLDLVVMRRVGCAIAVADAAPEVRQIAHYVTSQPGGQAAVREAVEYLLRNDGTWEAALAAIGADRASR
ncbi:MAG TPA: HAD hydrolase family protein, partial [Phycisphaerae bacterium]|nr:HAD hydrolase family protein [Phycisphaerae bacterium]